MLNINRKTRSIILPILAVISANLAVIPTTITQADAAQCYQGREYGIQNNLDRQSAGYLNSSTTVCGKNVRIKRTYRINPWNIDYLLQVKAFDENKKRQIEQICINLLDVNLQNQLNNSQSSTQINQNLNCKFVFKETNIFKVARGNEAYLRKVALLFNKIANFNVTIIGGSNLNVESSVVADNNSTSVVDLQLKTVLVSRAKQKNVVKLWHRADDETTDFLRSLLSPSSVIDVKCADTTNANQTQTSTNQSTSNNNVVNNLTCDVQADQILKFR